MSSFSLLQRKLSSLNTGSPNQVSTAATYLLIHTNVYIAIATPTRRACSSFELGDVYVVKVWRMY